MNKLHIALFSTLIILISCSFFTPQQAAQDKKKKMIVVGYAQNRKGGAYVVSIPDSIGYFVGDLSHWDEKILGKKVKVTGTLLVQHFEPLKPGEEERQMIVGTVRTLRKAKWELVK
ncbi:MAG: hypothetical protein J7621_25720 [Niastella sp.]|nr:hypothetical protein [Niastella sp.]